MRIYGFYIFIFSIVFTLPAYAQSNSCRSLQNQLANFRSNGSNFAQQQLNEIRKARNDLERLRCNSPEIVNDAQRLNQCESVTTALESMENNYARLARTSGDEENARIRQQLLSRIEVECGYSQIQQNAQNSPQPNVLARDQSSEAGFLSWLFERIQPRQNVNPQISNQFQDPTQEVNPLSEVGGGLRTLCVRKCDGYYWPVSFSSSPNNSSRDSSICEQMCPTQSTQLFYHYNQGQWSEDMVNEQGVPYKNMSYAFAYREKYSPECMCNTLKQPEGALPTNSKIEQTNNTSKLENPLALQPLKTLESFEIKNESDQVGLNKSVIPLQKNSQNPLMDKNSTINSPNVLRTPENLGISVDVDGSKVKYNDGALLPVPKLQ